jgi:hypothetical protein
MKIGYVDHKADPTYLADTVRMRRLVGVGFSPSNSVAIDPTAERARDAAVAESLSIM